MPIPSQFSCPGVTAILTSITINEFAVLARVTIVKGVQFVMYSFGVSFVQHDSEIHSFCCVYH